MDVRSWNVTGMTGKTLQKSASTWWHEGERLTVKEGPSAFVCMNDIMTCVCLSAPVPLKSTNVDEIYHNNNKLALERSGSQHSEKTKINNLASEWLAKGHLQFVSFDSAFKEKAIS